MDPTANAGAAAPVAPAAAARAEAAAREREQRPEHGEEPFALLRAALERRDPPSPRP